MKIDYEKLMKKIPYKYYDECDMFKRSTNGLNCSDEICPGSHKRSSRIRELLHKKIPLNDSFTETYTEIVAELKELHKEEMMGIADWDDHTADMWVRHNIDFNSFKTHVAFNGEKYVTIDPKIGHKYVGMSITHQGKK